jgi:hypothetical protein
MLLSMELHERVNLGRVNHFRRAGHEEVIFCIWRCPSVDASLCEAQR